MSWELPDPTRDEDRYYEDESMVPAALLEPDEPLCLISTPSEIVICDGGCGLSKCSREGFSS